MDFDSAFEIVVRFNDCITAQDLDELAELLTNDHRFIDTAGNLVEGKSAALRAWAGFFSAFPGYQNLFHHWQTHEGDLVIRGASRCSDADLNGPALWRAKVTPQGLAEWQVYDDTEENRRQLGL